MTKCVNLREMFGDRYTVQYEESYYIEHGDHGRTVDPCLMQIPCRHGFICAWGGQNLAACTLKNGPVATRLRRLPFVTVVQDGNDGINVMFPVEQFDAVAEVMKPRKRRRLSPEHKAKLAEAASKFHFPRGCKSPKSARKRESAARAMP